MEKLSAIKKFGFSMWKMEPKKVPSEAMEKKPRKEKKMIFMSFYSIKSKLKMILAFHLKISSGLNKAKMHGIMTNFQKNNSDCEWNEH